MYTIIGGDGQEYGPVPTDQIKAWIAGGRANLDTRAKALGTEEWKPLGEFPAFTPGGAEQSDPVAETAVSADPEAIATDLIARAGKLDIGSCYERSWQLLKSELWPLVGVAVLVNAVGLVFMLLPSPWDMLAASLLGGVLNGGLYYFFLLKVRGRPARLSDAFAGFSVAFAPLMLAGMASAGMVCLGLILLVIPGIYLAVAYTFVYILVIDRKMPFWTAMEVSRRVVTAQWWRVLGLLLLAIPFALLGIALLIVGVFFAMPLVFGAIVYAYEDLCNPR